MSELDRQVGGSHYESSYQPIQFIAKFGLNFFQGSILKYLTRYKKKNGREDLEKARHYALLAVELNPVNTIYSPTLNELKEYTKANDFGCYEANALYYLTAGLYDSVAECISDLIVSEYGV